MGFQKMKRPLKVPTSTGVYSIQGGISAFQATDMLLSVGAASASSAGTVVAWNKVTLLSAFSSAGGLAPMVVNMAAATSGAIAYLVGNAIAATSNGIAVRLQAATSKKTFDGLADQLLFTLPEQGAYLIAVSSSRVVYFGSSAMMTASTS